MEALTGDLFPLSEAQMAWISPWFLLSNGVSRADDRQVGSGLVYVIEHGPRRKDGTPESLLKKRFFAIAPHRGPLRETQGLASSPLQYMRPRLLLRNPHGSRRLLLPYGLAASYDRSIGRTDVSTGLRAYEPKGP